MKVAVQSCRLHEKVVTESDSSEADKCTAGVRRWCSPLARAMADCQLDGILQQCGSSELRHAYPAVVDLQRSEMQ